MTILYKISVKNLIDSLKGLKTGKTLDYLRLFITIILRQCESDPYYFSEHVEIANALFLQAYPSLVDYLISNQMYDYLIEAIPIYLTICKNMSLIRNFIFAPFLLIFYDKVEEAFDRASKSFYNFSYRFKYIKNEINLNIFKKYFIDEIVKKQIIQLMIIDIPFHTTFSECETLFKIFHIVFTNVNSSALSKFEAEFTKFSFSLEDPRFDEVISLSLTRSMSECSTKYALIHFENIIKFLMSDDNCKTAEKELISLLKNSENLNAISSNVLDYIDLIFASLRDDEELLKTFATTLVNNKIVTYDFFIEKAGNDLYLNLAFFEFAKKFYTKETVEEIVNSEEFCEKTVEFGFRIIEYKIDLMPNVPNFLRTCFSSYWSDEMMKNVVALSKIPSNRSILVDSIKGYSIKNRNDFKIVSKIISLLKPSKQEFDYGDFVNEILNYTDSFFILPYFLASPFIPLDSLDIEEFITFSVFSEKMANFLFDNFSEILIDHSDFLVSLAIDDDDENKCYGRFLFNLFKKSNAAHFELLLESLIRTKDEDEEVHSAVQKMISENPQTCQNEIISLIEQGYSNYFINFDFSTFSESSSEESAISLFFRKSLLTSQDSFFYFPSKICHALNHSEPFSESDVNELFMFQVGDAGIDAVILEMAFDAALKLNIEFPLIEKSLNIAFKLKFKKFIDKLFNYILNNSYEVNENLLKSFAEFDASYAAELFQAGKVDQSKVESLIDSPTISEIIRKINFDISANFLNNITYSKSDFIEFITSGKIRPDAILPFVFSKEFPQFYRTRSVLHTIFQLFESKPTVFLDFLKELKLKYSVIIGKNHPTTFIPYIKHGGLHHLYRAFALLSPTFENFPKPKTASFLSCLFYSRAGIDNPDLLSPYNAEESEVSRNLLTQRLDDLINELPYEVAQQFEIQYTSKNSILSTSIEIYHDFSMIVNENSVSSELKNFCIINRPKFLIFKIHKKNDFLIEKAICVNDRKYSLSCVATKSNLFVPKDSKFTKWSNGQKSVCDEIDGKIFFIFYQIENPNNFECLSKRLAKFRKSNYTFNARATICDSLNKANFDWKKWERGQTLYEIATILFSVIGYSELFKELSTDPQFSEFFFDYNWGDKYLVSDVSKEAVALANLYPRRETLVEHLFNSIGDISRHHLTSAILASFGLDDQMIEKAIEKISPHFESLRDLIMNYFKKPTTTNKLLLEDESLSEFVFSQFSEELEAAHVERFNSISDFPFAHLLNPMTDDLLLMCVNVFKEPIKSLIIESNSLSIKSIFSLISQNPKDEKLLSLFYAIKPDDESLRKSNEWIVNGLISSTKKIRDRTIWLIQNVFQKKDGPKLSKILKIVIIKGLFKKCLAEVFEFIKDYFGLECIDSPRFTELIFNKKFKENKIQQNDQFISSLIDILSPVDPSAINSWIEIISKYDTNSTQFLTYAGDIIYMCILIQFRPPFHGYLRKLLEPIYHNCDMSTRNNFLALLFENIRRTSFLPYAQLFSEFEVFIDIYMSYVNKLLKSYPDFFETETIIIALNLPQIVFTYQDLISSYSLFQCFEGSFDVSNMALQMILDKKAFIRPSGDKEISAFMYTMFSSSFLNFFFENYPYYIKSVVKNATEKYFESFLEAVKKAIKYATYSSLIFNQVLLILFKVFYYYNGFSIFNNFLCGVEREWSEFCCEGARRFLSDAELDSGKNVLMAVNIVDREFCTQLFKFNQAEKCYLRFMIAVLKNDKLRNEVKLQPNTQIFNVFRNDFVFCINDVAMFIDISLDKYENFFNETEIKNFILRLKVKDVQFVQKMEIVSNLFKKAKENMKTIIHDIFPKFEELISENMDNETFELVNQVFELSLESLA